MSLIDYFNPSPEKQSDSSSPEFLPPIVVGRAETVRRALDAINRHQRVIGLSEAGGVESPLAPPETTSRQQDTSEVLAKTLEMPQQMIDTSPTSQQMTTKDIARLQEYVKSIAQEGVAAQEGASMTEVDFGGGSPAGGHYDQKAA